MTQNETPENPHDHQPDPTVPPAPSDPGAPPVEPTLGGHAFPSAGTASSDAASAADPGQGSDAPTADAPASPVQDAPPAAPSAPAYGAPTAAYPGQDAGQQPTAAYPGADAGQQPTAAYPGQPGHPGADAGQQPTAAYPSHPGQPGQPGEQYGAPYGAGAPGAPAGPTYPGGPSYPGGPTPPAPGGGKKKLSTGALIAIIAGGVVLLLVIAAAIIIPLSMRGSGGSDSSGGDEPAPEASTPTEFVEGYLTALSEGDAEAAKAYVDTTSYDDSLLTDEVLQASLDLGAIDDIELGKEKESKYGDVVVPATFTVGGEEVSRDFEVYVGYDGDMTMFDGLVSASPYGFEQLELTVNGVEAPESFALFPGTYEFGVGVEAFAIEGESTYRLATDDDEEALYDLKPVLSESGIATFRELVTASLRECLAMKTFDTPCGLDVTDIDTNGNGFTPIDGTVTRTLTAEGESTLANLGARVTEGTVVSASDYLATDVTLDAQNAAGERGTFSTYGVTLETPKVDFGAEEPTVVWE